MGSPILQPREHVFETILGHDGPKRLFRAMIARNRLPRALLLHGRPGVGKKSLAYALAKYVNSYPDGDRIETETAVCRKIARGVFLDLVEIEPSGAGGQIRVESAQEAETRLATAPIEGRKKVLLILDAHRMNLATANAMLKTIEEPPSYALILLVTDRPTMLPATIRSRCSPVRCAEVEIETLANWLLEKTGEMEGDRDLARFFALLAEGAPGRALALTASDVLKGRDAACEALGRFHRRGYVAFMSTAHQLARGSEGLADALALLFTWYRDLAVSRVAPGEERLLINRDRAEDLRKWSEKMSLPGLVRALDRIAQRFEFADRIATPQLILESLLVDAGMATRA